MQRFILQGSTYYTQYRKCGKPACTTCSGRGTRGHGPYWYRRDRPTGKVHYIGKNLPEGIAATHAARRQLRPRAAAIGATLRTQQSALRSFIGGEHLTDQDIKILTAFDLQDGIL